MRKIQDRNEMELMLASDLPAFLEIVERLEGDVRGAQRQYYAQLLEQGKLQPGDLSLYNECMYDV